MSYTSVSHRKPQTEEFPTLSPEHGSGKADNQNQSTKSQSPSLQWWLLAIPSFLVSIYGALYFTRVTFGDPAGKARIISTFGGRAHIAGSCVAIGLGPFQFLPVLRQRYPAIHRGIGWAYAAGVASGGLAGFYVSFHTPALLWGSIGYAILATLWLETLRRSIMAIRRDGDLKGHQVWMTRNYSLTCAAIMLRWQFPLMMVMGIEFPVALSLVGYTAWIPNLFIAEYWVLRRS